jgi:hypothetical protein
LKLGKLVEVNLISEMVLVRREVAEAQISKQAPQLVSQGDSGSGTTSIVHVWPPPQVEARPRRFYVPWAHVGSIPKDTKPTDILSCRQQI